VTESLDDFEIAVTPGRHGTCTSCRPQGSCRLGLGAVEVLADGSIAVPAICPADWQGGPGVAHGGWVSAAFDEALALAVLQHDPRIVTRQLTVHYLKPAPVSRPLVFAGLIGGREERTWRVAGQLTLGRSGPVLATADGTFVSRRDDHYRRHRDWLRAAAHRLTNVSMLR
jgi:acyl-coenzyme A thioesterase PaaI-like protein